MPKIVRAKPLAQKISDKIREQLESNHVSLGDILRSERELAIQYKVSRKTIRSALSILVQEGYVISKERQGYQVKKSIANNEKNQLIAYVLGTTTKHWEMDSYSLETWNQIQKAALSTEKSVFALAKEDLSSTQIKDRLLKHKVKGVIVNADDPEIPIEINEAGIPLVMIDTASPSLESVNQNNFEGAYQLTNHLIKKGCKNIVWMGRHLDLLQGKERLGGYMTALHSVGIKSKETNIICSTPEKTKLLSLSKICNGPDKIDGIAIMWPQLITEVCEHLLNFKTKPQLALWWGGNPTIKETYKNKFNTESLPPGVHWNLSDLARAAILKLDDRIRNPNNPTTRTMVSTYFYEH